MKTKRFFPAIIAATIVYTISSCQVSYINTADLRANYEKKIHHTTMLGKALFKTDQRKLDAYENVQVFLDGNDVGRDYEVVAYGSYKPLILPLIRPERPRLEKYLLWKAARKARKIGANGVIIDNKNDFTIIQLK